MNYLKRFIVIAHLLTAIIIVNLNLAHGQQPLIREIAELIRPVGADVGVAFKQLERGDTASYSGSDHFPMQSVYKFHLAMAVLHAVDEGKITMDQEVFIRKEDLIPNTVSSIADQYPEGNITLTVKQLISYTVANSDNNGCDILFGLLGGPVKVQAYIQSLGINDVAIENTEAEMHVDQDLQYKNWTTPVAAVRLLDMFHQQKVLSLLTNKLLMEIMERTVTGKKRIKGLLPPATIVAHKTGMSGYNEYGVPGTVNDIGIMTLPNGQHVAIAFFVSNSHEKLDVMEALMAKISRLVYDYYATDKE